MRRGHEHRGTGPEGVAALLLTGTVGAGKTSAAIAAGELLEQAGIAAVVLDLDWLGWSHLGPEAPTPHQLIAQNLAAIWPNLLQAGMRRAVLTRAVRAATEVQGLRSAVGGTPLTVIRLTATPSTLAARLRVRDRGAELRDHLTQAAAFAAAMDRDLREVPVVATDGLTPESVAAAVLTLSGWMN
ncbi:MAG: hypothetical protein M3024_08825 [Candidatus Dormibacteraeota bacterium]|nr:hypothetical protein [Candidatus Dormibacteraeota bacterium]